MDTNAYDDINAYISLTVKQDLLLRQVSATLHEIEISIDSYRFPDEDPTYPKDLKRSKIKKRKKWFIF